MRRYECEFETVEAEAQGCSLFGGAGIVTQAHREVIRRRGADGWRLTACIPARQRGEGFVEAWDLIFERERETQVKTAYVVQAVCGDGRPV